MRVLLVDDDRLVRVTLASGLSRLGHEVIDVENAEEALQALDDGGFDVVVSDLVMPGIGGLGLGREMAARGHRTMRIALTASQLTRDEHAAAHALFDRVLGKPLSPDALDELLSRRGVG